MCKAKASFLFLLQESKAFHMDELDKLGVEKVELQQSLSESIKTTDEVMATSVLVGVFVHGVVCLEFYCD